MGVAAFFAQGFYEKHGFAAIGRRFELPVAGPHYVMFKNLADAAAADRA